MHPLLNTFLGYLQGNEFFNMADQRAQPKFDFNSAIVMMERGFTFLAASFPEQGMKNDHLEGYCICKALLHHSPVYNIVDDEVLPLSHVAAGAKELNKKTLEDIQYAR